MIPARETRYPRTYRAVYWYKSNTHWWYHELAGDRLMTALVELQKRQELLGERKFKSVVYDVSDPTQAQRYLRLVSKQNPPVDDLGVF